MSRRAALRARGQSRGDQQRGQVYRVAGRQVVLGHVGGHLAALEHGVEAVLGGLRGVRAVVQRTMRRATGAWPRSPALPRRDLLLDSATSRGCRSVQSRAYSATTGIRDAHQLAELLRRRLGDGDVVAERLAHLLHAVGADEQRDGEHRLRRLTARALQFPADQVVEGLVGAAELDVGADLDRVDRPAAAGR